MEIAIFNVGIGYIEIYLGEQVFNKYHFTNNLFVQTIIEHQISAWCTETGEISPEKRAIRVSYQLVPVKDLFEKDHILFKDVKNTLNVKMHLNQFYLCLIPFIVWGASGFS